MPSAESMAAKVAAFDWSANPLGVMERWPQSLRTAVDICLNSRFPMFVWWGPDLINIHNDAYVPVLGERQAWALGAPAKKIWTELWPVIGQDVSRVMQGEAVSRVRERLVLERNGYAEETFFTYSHSPIPDDHGGVGGLFQVCYDETATVLAERILEQRVDEAQQLSISAEQQAALLNRALTHMNDFAFMVDRQARFRYANSPLLQLWNLTLDKVIGKTFAELAYAPDMAARLQQQIRQVFNTGTLLVDETPYTGANGTEGFYEYIFTPVLAKDGSVEVVLGTSRDITLRKRAELEREQMLHELQAERANLATIVAEAPAFIVVLRGPHHTIELVNQNYRKLIGRSDVLGKTVAEALPEVVSQGFITLLDNVYETGHTFFGVETPVVVGPPGAEEHHYVNFVYQAMRGSDGAISGVFVHGVDVTESVSARVAMENSERQRRLALETAELGAWHIEFGTLKLTGDTRFREIFGLRENQLSYDEAFLAIHPDDRDRVRVAVEASMQRVDPVPYEAEYRIVHPDGTTRWVLGKGRPNISRVQPRITQSLDGTVVDITQRKHDEVEREHLLQAERTARSEAELAGRMKDEFLATLSHEIRTPLNAILGWAHIMQHSGKSEDIQRGIEVIERNARAQSQIIDDLLDMSSIISGKIRLNVQHLNLAEIVEGAVAAARPAAGAKNIGLDSVIDPMHGVEVSGDANRIQQVLWNLISNAVKFTGKGGQVRVLLKRVHSNLEISVIDTGEGIAPNFLPHVFDRFRQGDASNARRHGGLGLGLSIVRQLVELHGGTVRAESKGLDQGSTFVVVLPFIAVQDKAEPASESEHARASRATTKLSHTCDELQDVKVLIIDDEPDARALLRRLLEDCGANVTTAVSTDEVVRLVQEQKFDVLVSDIGMPGEDGYSLIRRVRQLGQTRNGNIPAIALTAYARAEDRVKAVAAGFQMHIAKPVESVELITMVASAAGRIQTPK